MEPDSVPGRFDDWHLEVDQTDLMAPMSASTVVVLVTASDRMVLTPDDQLTIYSRTPGAGMRPSTVQLEWCNDAEVGQPWRYAVRGRILPVWTEPVEEIHEIGGDLAWRGPIDVVDRDADEARCRKEVSEVWISDVNASGVRVWIKTQGDWDGMWLLARDETGQVFAPTNPAAPLRTWTGLRTNGWANVGSTLWLDTRIAPGVWTTVDRDGCGTVVSIVIEHRSNFL